MLKAKKTIQIGDTIKVVNPEIVERVGYPLSFNDALIHVNAFREEIESLLTVMEMDEADTDKLKRELASQFLRSRRWGGRSRRIHTRTHPEKKDGLFKVIDKRVVVTGEYDVWTEVDDMGTFCSQPYLANSKRHVLIKLVRETGYIDETFEIEQKNVEKA